MIIQAFLELITDSSAKMSQVQRYYYLVYSFYYFQKTIFKKDYY